MLLRLRVTILFGHAKVNHVNDIGSFGPWSSNEEIVWFDVTIDEVFLVDGLDTRQLPIISRGLTP